MGAPPRHVALALATMALIGSGCDSGSRAPRAAEPAAPRSVEVAEHGLELELPPGWHVAQTSLTPGLVDPREVLSAGTYPLVDRESACGHMPVSALDDLPAGGAFVTLEERGLDPSSTWEGFPRRPEHFGPELGGPSEAGGCAPDARFSDHWFGFTDAGRHFHVLVAFGPQASDAVRRETWGLLDSLRVDPDVRPDWRSAG